MCLQRELARIHPIQLNTSGDIDNLLMYLIDSIKKAADESVPSKSIKPKGHKNRIWSLIFSDKENITKLPSGDLSKPKMMRTKHILRKNAKRPRGTCVVHAERKEHAVRRIEEYNTIMRASSEDELLMYRMIRRHRKTSKSMQTELLVKGELVSQPDEVRSTWADHFEMLATPQEDDTFENKFKAQTDDSIEVIKIISRYMAATSAVDFSHDEITIAISRLKKKKSC